MNFFDAQDRARRASKWLVVVYALATIAIVAGVTAVFGFALFALTADAGGGETFLTDNAGLLTGVAVLTALFILAASAYRTASLSSGGGKVARQLGGTLVPADVSDPLRRRLRNVVEEMAIASGVPVPEIYVLEAESGINAFAAGYAPGDAAIAVTRGTLELLDRDELQGVVAHEFSHVLNGDMRLNIRLMGVLFGILALGLMGRTILRTLRYSSLSGERSRGVPIALLVGTGLLLIGFIGVFFGRLIKAAVSRQREYLADASAVQFTRQTRGIAGALKKIGGYSAASFIQEADPEEVSHMLFGSGSRLFGWFATHPPLAERIRALDPGFSPDEYPDVDALAMRRALQREDEIEARAAGITTAFAEGGVAVLPESIAESVGEPEDEHVDYARGLRASIPAELYDAAHSSELAYLLTLALILSRHDTTLDSQFRLLDERFGSERTQLIRRYHEALAATGAEYRLPLLEVAFPALKRRPAAQLEYLVDAARRLIDADDDVDLYEFCFYRILTANLKQALAPGSGPPLRRVPRRELRTAAVSLLAIVADHGHRDAASRDAAYAAGAAVLGDWASDYRVRPQRERAVDILDQSLDRLLVLNGKGRRKLLLALSAVAAHDRRLNVAEAELIRAICATLDCPLPPILVRNQ